MLRVAHLHPLSQSLLETHDVPFLFILLMSLDKILIQKALETISFPLLFLPPIRVD